MIYSYSENELAGLLRHVLDVADDNPKLSFDAIVSNAVAAQQSQMLLLGSRYIVVERPMQGLAYVVLSADHFEFTCDPSVRVNAEQADTLVRDAAGAMLQRMQMYYRGISVKH
jgi:hypothetical protein